MIGSVLTGSGGKTMPDKEKVFDAIRNCITEPKCRDCPWDDCERFDCKRVDVPVSLLLDALKLLKEQEAKTGHWIDTTKVIGFPRVQCSVCGSGQGAIWMNYCPNCGAKMEGR